MWQHCNSSILLLTKRRQIISSFSFIAFSFFLFFFQKHHFKARAQTPEASHFFGLYFTPQINYTVTLSLSLKNIWQKQCYIILWLDSPPHWIHIAIAKAKPSNPHLAKTLVSFHKAKYERCFQNQANKSTFICLNLLALSHTLTCCLSNPSTKPTHQNHCGFGLGKQVLWPHAWVDEKSH